MNAHRQLLSAAAVMLLNMLGHLLKTCGLQVGPIILGPLMDCFYRQAMISTEAKVPQFAGGFFTSPFSLIILAALTLTVASQTSGWRRLREQA